MSNTIGKSVKNDWIIVIYEFDLKHQKSFVIGVANTREIALEIIREYYGEDAKISKPRIIEDSGLNFYVSVSVKGQFGGEYRVTGMDFEINKL